MTITPLNHHIVVRRDDAPTRTASGIYLAGKQETPQTGIVLAVCSEHDTPIAPLDRVIFPKFAGTDVTLQGEELTIIKETDLLGRVTLEEK
jgi:chaperonin GroES